MKRNTNSHRGMTKVEFLVVLAIIGILILLLLPATECSREAPRRMQCTNNIKVLGIGIHNYHDKHEAFPPAIGLIELAVSEEPESGEASEVSTALPKPASWSWRVRILPFIEQKKLFDQFHFDEPWDSEHNLTVAETMPDYFSCPSDNPEEKVINAHAVPLTSYVMITGSDTIGSPDGNTLTWDDVKDGRSNTLMIVEVTGDYRPAWTEPVDISIADLRRNVNAVHGKSIGSQHPGGANIGLCDGSVHFFSDEGVSGKRLQQLGRINDGTPDDWD
jgi:prepilin-type N-terminal cleavage/methylation domain-containing protein/prepilin-type processing-associated H-X9-DG protein